MLILVINQQSRTKREVRRRKALDLMNNDESQAGSEEPLQLPIESELDLHTFRFTPGILIEQPGGMS